MMVEDAGKPAVEPGFDSEGEAPELVTLSSGREEAQKLRKDERENQRRVQAEAKQRRQKSARQTKKDVSTNGQHEGQTGDLLEESARNSAQDEQGNKHVRGGLLDDSIVNFLAAQERERVETKHCLQEEDQPCKQERAKKHRRPDAREPSNSLSRVKVVSLDSERPTLANVHKAMEFKKSRLYGDHIRRSVCMLSKLRSV